MDNEFRHTNPEIDVHAMGEMHEHPTWKEYKWVALILTLITVVEVWVYYTPFSKSALFSRRTRPSWGLFGRPS